MASAGDVAREERLLDERVPAAPDLHRTVAERVGTGDVADGEPLQRWREGLRTNRTALAVVEKLRIYNCDRDRTETFAVMRGISAAELVRVAALAAVGERSVEIASGDRTSRLIERMFRYTHIFATALRNEMLEKGRAEELEELIRSARELQAELQNGSSD